MTSVTGAPLDGSNEVSQRIALLPTLAGAGAILVLIVGATLAGLAGDGRAQGLVWLATGLVAMAMISGFVPAHYLGLAVLVVAALAAPDDGVPSTAIVVVTLGLCHEVGRFSLDARRPTRFAPGYLRRFSRRAMFVTLAALAAFGIDWALDRATPTAAAIPFSLVLVSAPLFLRRSILTLPAAWRSSSSLRIGLGALVAAIAVGAAIVGAEARSTVTYEPPTADVSPAEAGDEDADIATVGRTDSGGVEPIGGSRQLVTVLVGVIVLLVMGLLLIALRRPEVAFELDDLHLDVDSRSLSISNPGEADLDDDDLVIDERAYARLLDDLLIDIASEADPARAIRFGYVTVENRLADAGIARKPSETEQDLLRRALPTLPGDRGSLVTLTTLFERARFGTEPVTEAMRTRAVAAVSALKNELSSSEPETPNPHEGPREDRL